MTPTVKSVRHVADYRLELSFDDELVATVDFAERILGRPGVWEPLHNIDFFKQARVDRELATIVWPNGVDICPDILYSLASGKPIEWVNSEEATIKRM